MQAFRIRLADWLETPRVRYSILAVILLNAVVLGFETSASVMARHGALLSIVDQACLAIFLVEIALKLFAQGWRFFARFWNVFDFVIIGIALVPARRVLRCCGRCASCVWCAPYRSCRVCAGWSKDLSAPCRAWLRSFC